MVRISSHRRTKCQLKKCNFTMSVTSSTHDHTPEVECAGSYRTDGDNTHFVPTYFTQVKQIFHNTETRVQTWYDFRLF